MYSNSKIAKAVRLAMFAGAASTLAISAPAFSAEENAEEVERIEVTGSRIKRTDLESAVPVTVLTADDMLVKGFNNVQDALASLSSVTGTNTTQSVHGFTPAASSISLRNAGANRTLTLINGKRLNQYPKPLGGTDNFVDTANLPMEAIDRIEVLNSGGGAIYGADAVGGVVNIILKRDYEGLGFKARMSDTSEGGGARNKFALSFGVTGEKGNISTFIEYEDSERLEATDRENFGLHTDKVEHSKFSSYSSYGGRIGNLGGLDEAECTAGGFFYRPNGVCGFDRSKWRDLAPETKRVSVITTYNYELTDDIRMVGRVDASEASSNRNIEPMGIDAFNVNVTGDTLTMTSDQSPGRAEMVDKTLGFGGDFAEADDGDYWYVRRAWEFGPRGSDTENRSFFASAGLEGTFNDQLDWDASMNFARTRVEVFDYGYATSNGMFDYLTQGEHGVSMLDPFTPETVEAIAYEPFEIAESSRINYQFNVTGEAFEMPAGMVSFASGVEWSKQTFASDSDAESKKGAILTTGGSSGKGARDMWAAYLEMIFPVTDQFNVNAAVRYDDYSDFGGNVTPQISAEYRPTDELLIRAVVGSVFRAPDMHRVYGDPTAGSNTVIDFKGCESIGGTPGDGIDRVVDPCNELHISQNTGANSELKAEEGYTANLGFVYSDDALDASVDVWKWKLDDMVNDIDADTVAERYDLYEHLITRDPATGFIDTIDTVAQNLSYQEVSGIDFSTGYKIEMGEYGLIYANIQGTYLLDSEGQANPTAVIDDDLEDTNVVQLRMTGSVNWQYEDLSLNLFSRYIGRHHGTSFRADIQNPENTESDLEVASHITWNLTGGYAFTDDIKVQVGVVNMFDRGPNFDPTNKSWPHYSRSLYNAVGREMFIEGEFRF
ncbi:TonB-dependent receptor plug domain-containing protein [Thalassotalea sp. PLHSN55]|uniref:TonB-dependent receptor plug domain-containing protein n=1 Tax=Thalassotalea sp. PLHSN55 TaxID=3435888 RepID=UPI003F873991